MEEDRMPLPLTPAQQKAVDALVRSGALRAVRPDEKKARAFLAGAESALADVPNVTRTENRYNLAYKAAHDVGEAVLAGYGYKTTYGAGGHVKVGRFLAAIFDTPPPRDAAAHYDVMRLDRNANNYLGKPVTHAAADTAAEAAQTLYDAAVKRLAT
jgi:hypothetical protein